MSQYKVPQDVEADDKLIGPFSFRQFIYLIIVALAILLAWFLGQLFLPLAIIPLPVILLFGVIALPLRKDQPMEIYVAAIVSYFLKPHKRLWDPDGIDSLIEITAPKTVEPLRTKDISQTEVQRRFGYLADIADTHGWAVRGPGIEKPDGVVSNDVIFESEQTRDVLDADDLTSKAIEQKLNQSDVNRRNEMIGLMQNPVATAPAPATQSLSSQFSNNVTPTEFTDKYVSVTTPDLVIDKPLEYNPYPEIQQSVIQPIDDPSSAAKPPVSTSEKVVPAGIINLASNTDLSVAAIAREANRIQEKQDLNDEVVIALR